MIIPPIFDILKLKKVVFILTNSSLGYWIPIFATPVISVVSIFISNWLGRKSESRKYQMDMLNNAYNSYYIPLIKFLVSTNEKNLTYYWLVASWQNAPESHKIRSEKVSSLLNNNLEFLPPEIVQLVSPYTSSSSNSSLFFGTGEDRMKYLKYLKDASDLFDEIIEISLKEASSISNKLGYPDIAKPILETFLNLEKTDMNFPRYLPEIYQTPSQE